MIRKRKGMILLIGILLQVLLLFSSCLQKYDSGGAYYSDTQADWDESYMEEAPNADLLSSTDSSSRGLFANKALDLSDGEFQQNQLAGQDGQNNPEQPQEAERKRIYSGSVDLVVEDVTETKRRIEKYANDIGGYVESMYATSMVIRIPAVRFDEAFSTILEQGKVRYQSIETADITEMYSDLDSRLAIARTSRQRLYELLARTDDTNEQVKILTEIGRLTEEIESIELLLQTLDSYISYSRISVTMEPRLNTDNYSRQDIPFDWIRNLSPLYASSNDLDAQVELEPGDEFAVFDKEDIYRAENFNGVQLRISTVDNDPVGDGEFWEKALMFHLDDFYAEGETKELPFGDQTVYGVLWTSKDREPFQYFTGAVVDGRKLHVVEIFSPEVDDAVIEELFAALAEGGIK